jgi:hypothetical protein
LAPSEDCKYGTTAEIDVRNDSKKSRLLELPVSCGSLRADNRIRRVGESELVTSHIVPILTGAFKWAKGNPRVVE